MSRGHGSRQRGILDRVRDMGARGQYVTPKGATASDAAALRRAAYKLEREGRIQLRVYRGRLTMWRPDVEPPVNDGYVQGADGRFYRSPSGALREDIEADREKAARWRAFIERYSDIADEHGHPHGPGILLCIECAEAAGADTDLLDRIRAVGERRAEPTAP